MCEHKKVDVKKVEDCVSNRGVGHSTKVGKDSQVWCVAILTGRWASVRTEALWALPKRTCCVVFRQPQKFTLFTLFTSFSDFLTHFSLKPFKFLCEGAQEQGLYGSQDVLRGRLGGATQPCRHRQCALTPRPSPALFLPSPFAFCQHGLLGR